MSTPPDPVRNDPADPASRTRPSANTTTTGAVAPSSRPSQWRRPAMIGAGVVVVLLILILLF